MSHWVGGLLFCGLACAVSARAVVFPVGAIAAASTGHKKMPVGARGMLDHVHDPQLNVCVQGAATEGTQADSIRQAVGAWLGALRPVAQDGLVDKIVLLDALHCTTPDAWITFHNQFPPIRANTQSGGVPSIHVNLNDPYAVIVHEFGHAFGLADTYIEGSDTPQPGQPWSLMSSTRFSSPQEDDISGIRSMYVEKYGRGRSRRAQSEDTRNSDRETTSASGESGRCQIGWFHNPQTGQTGCGIQLNGNVVAWIVVPFTNQCSAQFVATYMPQVVQLHCPGAAIADVARSPRRDGYEAHASGGRGLRPTTH